MGCRRFAICVPLEPPGFQLPLYLRGFYGLSQQISAPPIL